MEELSPVVAAVEKALGFEDYKTIISMVNSVDVSKCTDFQTAFDRYYRVRRNDAWRAKFYKYFESVKCDKDISFDAIIDYIYDNMKTVQGNSNPVEASFSSKMLATIDTNKPILDSQVLKNMGLSIVGETPEKRLQSSKKAYKDICERFENYIGTVDCDEAVKLFDSYFPGCKGFSVCKKIDWFLWALEKDGLTKLGIFGALYEQT